MSGKNTAFFFPKELKYFQLIKNFPGPSDGYQKYALFVDLLNPYIIMMITYVYFNLYEKCILYEKLIKWHIKYIAMMFFSLALEVQ